MKDKVNFKNPNTYLKTVTSFANGKCIGYIIFGIEPENKEIYLRKKDCQRLWPSHLQTDQRSLQPAVRLLCLVTTTDRPVRQDVLAHSRPAHGNPCH